MNQKVEEKGSSVKWVGGEMIKWQTKKRQVVPNDLKSGLLPLVYFKYYN